MQLFEIISFFTYGISKLIPKKKNRWIFGAWFGQAVSDNTKAFFDYLAENHPEIEKIWVSSDPEKTVLPGTRVVKRNSISSLKYILRAEVAVMNQGFGDFAAFNLLGGALKVQLWHGVAWKKIGLDAFPEITGLKKRLFLFINHYDLFIAPSEKYGNTLKRSFGADKDQITYVGQPRNQCLFDSTYCKNCHEYLLNKASESEKKILVYMPTFRDTTEDVFSFCNEQTSVALGELAERFGFILIEKTHFNAGSKEAVDLKNRHIYQMPSEDAQVLLGAADMLITDYSSCFFDYLIRNKPIIHFIYDYEFYKTKDRGLYYEVEDVACGPLAHDQKELFELIEKNLICDSGETRRTQMIEEYITFESDHNCEKIYQKIIGKIRQSMPEGENG